jgi:hypothetical protein
VGEDRIERDDGQVSVTPLLVNTEKRGKVAA